MKGTQEKVDLLMTCKPREPEQDGLTFVKMCQRREMQLNTGKVVTDEELRTFIEDCVERLRIKAIRGSIKKVDAVTDGQHGDIENKKKADAPSPSKKIKKEVNAAERAKKPSYNNAPPPAQQPEGGAGNAKPKCRRCFGGGFHEKQPEQCRAGYKHVKLEPGYHEGKLSANKWWEVENAAIRMYNLKNCFKNSDWGILVTDWQQLPNEEKDKYRATQAPVDKKNPTVKAEALKAEYRGMVAARQTASRAGSVRSQVLSEDDGSDEELTGSVAERDEHSSRLHEVNHREAPGPSPAAATSSSVTSTAAGDVDVDAFADELHTLSLEVGAAACVNQEEKTMMIAAPAVALGSTQKMRGFPVKTPEEFDAEAQVPRAPAADEMQREVQRMASLLKSTRKAFHKMTVGMVRQGYITAPRDIETLVELADAGQLPMPAALAADRGDCEGDTGEDEEDPESLVSGSDSDAEEIPLDEMSEDVVDQPKKRRTSITAASAAIQGSHDVEDFSVKGRAHAGNMGAQAYELLKERMLSGLTEEQITAMAQVQPVCKLLNDKLAQGMALVAAGGLLMLYNAILLDTGANCNIIPIRTVKQLRLTIFDAETGARVARCDGSPAEFTKYYYVDVILAAGLWWRQEHCDLARWYKLNSLDESGFLVNLEKSVLKPMQRLAFLGMGIDSVRGLFYTPQQKWDSLQSRITAALRTRRVKIRGLASIAGKVKPWPRLCGTNCK
ncbi:hypothetical protein CYMTET_17992 [Cymbomonas tetramitiformis]|uniref:Uncharacterized protein n=1 Tax=Cymbomonas tetramitiformis TaxID=36881 RepID=A0AAE0L6L0_9CHLO|nr:hypothetical protein CYMTET_17992 [Cymbomonas tetramitiformis]